jgi:hypothetical protein
MGSNLLLDDLVRLSKSVDRPFEVAARIAGKPQFTVGMKQDHDVLVLELCNLLLLDLNLATEVVCRFLRPTHPFE